MRLGVGYRGVFGCLGVLAVLAACGGGTASSTGAGKYVATAVIGPAGGTLPFTAAEGSSLAGTSIVIPPNALSASTTISIGISTESVTPKGGKAAGPVVDFEPSGTVFALPVTVTIPVTVSNASAGSLFIEAVEADGSAHQITVDSIASGLATFKTSGFTNFGAFTGASAGTCASDSDCASGTSCVSGECVGTTVTTTIDGGVDGDIGPGDICKTDSDCPADFVCESGHCESGTTTVIDGGSGGGDSSLFCATDADCATGTSCVDGECTGTTTVTDAGCGADSECAAGATCCGGVCADIESDSDNCGSCGTACAAGQSCSEGACSSATTHDAGASDSCSNDSECAPGESCVGNVCQA